MPKLHCSLFFTSLWWTVVLEAARLPEKTGLTHFPRLEDGLYHIDRSNYAEISGAIASSSKEIILTTISFQHEGKNQSQDQLALISNFAFFLHQSNRLQNTLILSYDDTTCRAVLAAGILCFLDEAAPQPDTLPGMQASVLYVSSPSNLSCLQMQLQQLQSRTSCCQCSHSLCMLSTAGTILPILYFAMQAFRAHAEQKQQAHWIIAGEAKSVESVMNHSCPLPPNSAVILILLSSACSIHIDRGTGVVSAETLNLQSRVQLRGTHNLVIGCCARGDEREQDFRVSRKLHCSSTASIWHTYPSMMLSLPGHSEMPLLTSIRSAGQYREERPHW